METVTDGEDGKKVQEMEGVAEISSFTREIKSSSPIDSVTFEIIASEEFLSSSEYDNGIYEYSLWCVWYDEIDGGWSTSGCSAKYKLEENTAGDLSVECTCSHLTRFSIGTFLHFFF